MKHQLSKPLTYCLNATLTLMLVACQKTNDATPATTCNVTRQAYSQTGSSGSYTSDVLYNYDATGRFVSQTYQTVNTPKTGNKSTGTSKRTLVYNADGFLVSESSTYESTENGKTSLQSNNTTYEYAEGRLMKMAQRSIGTTGDVSNYSIKYEYDANGKVAKTTADSRGTLYIQTFTNGLLTKFLVRDVNGIETQPATINGQGLITKNVRGSNSYDTYEYDAQQRVVREESWFNNKLYYYRLTEYDDKKSAYESGNPVFKGHPVIVTNGKYSNNATRYTTYGQDNTGAIKKQADNVYTYTYNAKGYPLDYTFADAVTGITGKATFTLTDCD